MDRPSDRNLVVICVPPSPDRFMNYNTSDTAISPCSWSRGSTLRNRRDGPSVVLSSMGLFSIAEGVWRHSIWLPRR